MSLRFPKAVRLVRASEFALLKKEGSSFHGRFIVLSVLRRAEPDSTRIGIITSRRVGKAVDRNRVRRRIRELFRRSRTLLRNDCWVVVVARRYAATAAHGELEGEWTQLIRRSGLLADASRA